MNLTRTFAALLVLLLAASSLQAQEMVRRQKLTAAVRRALEAGASSVRVIVRMRSARPVQPVSGLESAGPGVFMALRRDEARRSAAALLADLAGRTQAKAMPAAPRASQLGGAAQPAHPSELWIANALCVDATPQMLADLAGRGDVERVYRDVRIQAIPRPELRGGAGTLAAAGSNWGLDKLRVREAWESHAVQGQGVVVGHIDTGVDATHPALAGKVLRFRDFVNGIDTPYDDEGHGTHTAGIIAGGDSIGVAPGARLVVAKALDSSGSGQLSTLLMAMQWMLDPDGDPSTDDRPVCVSNSWGVDRRQMRDLGAEETFFWDAVQAWRDASILPLFAAGNSGANTEGIPAGYPIAIAVGATGSGDEVPSFSTGGRTEWAGTTYVKPDLAAPGDGIVSAAPNGRYRKLSGSSMACPQVAGVVALMKQARPHSTMKELESFLMASLVDIHTPGRDDRSGLGRIDAMTAVSNAVRGPSAPPVAPPAPRQEIRNQVARGVMMLVAGLLATWGLSLLF